MFIIDDALVGGIRFVLEKLGAVVDQELNDPERWRSELLELQLKLENGEIGEDEFVAREQTIMAELRRLHPESSGVVASASDVSGVSIMTDDDE